MAFVYTGALETQEEYRDYGIRIFYKLESIPKPSFQESGDMLRDADVATD